MDACTTEEDVRGAITQAGVGLELAIRITNANNRGQRLAIVTVQESEATKLLKVGKPKNVKLRRILHRSRRKDR